jgi:thioredoxin-related protein
MHRAGTAIVQVDMRSNQPVLDFSGKLTTHDQLARQWKVSITPTLLFFGPGGKEVAERMEGAYLPDFYGPYLDERMAQGSKSL